MHRRQTSVVTFTELRHHLEQGSIFIFIFQNEERKEEIEKQFVGRLYKNVNSSKTRSASLNHSATDTGQLRSCKGSYNLSAVRGSYNRSLAKAP